MDIFKNPKQQIFPGSNKFRSTKVLTFDNDTGTLTLFTVTGDIRVEIIPICKTSVLSVAAANIRLGIVGNTDAMLVDVLSTELDANEFWNMSSPSNEIQASDQSRMYDISNGNNIILTLDGQVDSGAITFYCYWSPHSTDGLLVVA